MNFFDTESNFFFLMDIRKHACMLKRTHIHLSKIVTAMSHFTASGLNKKNTCAKFIFNPRINVDKLNL